MTNVIDMHAARMAKREEELRQRFGIEPDQTANPIGYAAAMLVDRTRLQMASRRNQEAGKQ